MELASIAPGAVVGRWTVLNTFVKTAKNEKKWLCRCECGTERYVLERSLKHGDSVSCGCLRRERAYDAVAHDVLGKTFGDLTVVGRSKKRTKLGAYWTCLCSCGYTCEATASELVNGHKTHCGCKTVKNYASADIRGQRFGWLVALYQTRKRDCTKIYEGINWEKSQKKYNVWGAYFRKGFGEKYCSGCAAWVASAQFRQKDCC